MSVLLVICPECGWESPDVWLVGCCTNGHEPVEILQQEPEPEASS